jgi:hypothetical protein
MRFLLSASGTAGEQACHQQQPSRNSHRAKYVARRMSVGWVAPRAHFSLPTLKTDRISGSAVNLTIPTVARHGKIILPHACYQVFEEALSPVGNRCAISTASKNT